MTHNELIEQAERLNAQAEDLRKQAETKRAESEKDAAEDVANALLDYAEALGVSLDEDDTDGINRLVAICDDTIKYFKSRISAKESKTYKINGEKVDMKKFYDELNSYDDRFKAFFKTFNI